MRPTRHFSELIKPRWGTALPTATWEMWELLVRPGITIFAAKR